MILKFSIICGEVWWFLATLSHIQRNITSLNLYFFSLKSLKNPRIFFFLIDIKYGHNSFSLMCYAKHILIFCMLEIKPVSLEGNQHWIFIGRTMTEAEAPILWHLLQRADSLEKTLMLGKTEGKRGEGGRGWDGWMASPTQWTEFNQTPGDSGGERVLVCYGSWGRKESEMI